MMRMGPGQLIGQGLPMASMAALLSQQLGRTVMDQTGLKGNYDFTLQWTPDQMPAAMPLGPVGSSSRADAVPPPRFFRAFDLHCASGTTWAEIGIN